MPADAARPLPDVDQPAQPFRVLLIAPFERGRSHGGSQRATSLAERLEARGATVHWHVTAMGSVSRAAKLHAALAGRPTLVLLHDRAPAAPPGDYDAVVAVHSYLAPQLERVVGAGARIVDFQDVQWRHLADLGSRKRASARLWDALQVRLMRAFEQRIVQECPLMLFSSPDELQWANSTGAEERALFVPNVLPREFVEQACEIARARQGSSRGEDARLVYMGTLDFPPNMLGLQSFLAHSWPRVQARLSSATLTIVGRCSEPDRRALEEHAGVTALGFVEDPRAQLVSATAAILPFDGTAGSSLRVLFYALAEVPLIGSTGAFRGISYPAGLIVNEEADWTEAVCRCLTDDAHAIIRRAREGARALQGDEGPWDTAWAALRRLADPASMDDDPPGADAR